MATSTSTSTEQEGKLFSGKAIAKISHGPFAGEAGVDGASVILWARATEPGGIVTFTIKDEDGKQVAKQMVEALKDNDYTVKGIFKELLAGKKYTGHVDDRSCSFITRCSKDQSFSFVFGSCLGGQKYGRTTEGWTIFDQMALLNPDFFLFTGDTIYADNPIPETAELLDKSERKNIPHDVICKELGQFRERYRYHLEDPNYAKFLSQTTTYPCWDDHEIIDDWGGEKMMESDQNLLKAGVKAFFEYWPCIGPEEKSHTGRKLYRSFESGQAEVFILDTRGYRAKYKNFDKDQPPMMSHILGEEQKDWFLKGLTNSTCLWKIIVSSIPLSFPTGFPKKEEVRGHDGWTADTELLKFFENIRDTKAKNMLFVSGDVHFPYFIHYDPWKSGKPFCYEFGASPICGLSLKPKEVEATLNPTFVWAKGEFIKGPMTFGHFQMSGEGKVSLKFYTGDGSILYSTEISPEIS